MRSKSGFYLLSLYLVILRKEKKILNNNFLVFDFINIIVLLRKEKNNLKIDKK